MLASLLGGASRRVCADMMIPNRSSHISPMLENTPRHFLSSFFQRWRQLTKVTLCDSSGITLPEKNGVVTVADKLTFLVNRELRKTTSRLLLLFLDLVSTRKHSLHVHLGCEDGLGFDGAKPRISESKAAL